ncbi:MAG: potassium channel family protein [Geminicoccaceae bacterium]
MPASRNRVRGGALGALQRSNYAWLLVALLLLILVSALFDSAPYQGAFVLTPLLTLVLIATVFALSEHRRDLLVAGTLAAAWLLLTWGTIGSTTLALEVSERLLLICLNIYAIAVILMQIITRNRDIDLNIVMGTLAIYMLLGVTWAVAYDLIEEISPGSFQVPKGDQHSRWNQLLFFSFTTLTTLGYGDITPNSAFARILSVIEAMTGVLFVAVMIARTVSLLKR